jgi:alpha-galactosidase
MPPRGSQPDSPVPPSLLPSPGLGWLGPTALEGTTANGRMLVPLWRATCVDNSPEGLSVSLADEAGDVDVGLDLAWDGVNGVVTVRARAASGADGLYLSRLASLCLPLPDWTDELIVLDGRWVSEGRPHRMAAPPGAWERVNRTGRTGFPGSTLLVGEKGFGPSQGRCILLHLAWSGSHRLRVETDPDGQRCALLEALLEPGEVQLKAGEGWATPPAMAVYSPSGLDGAAHRLNVHARAHILPVTPATPLRPVHFNTWEAVYFDFDEGRLGALARQAAALGCERFVLDDGWFKGRCDDRRALGDWTPDPFRFPQGLRPLIDEVQRLGMTFGLWVEPEMVSPDSDLMRARPDWALGAGGPLPGMRHQLVLDLAREDVASHVHDAVASLLRAHPVSYLKWDFNRDLFPPTSAGRAVSHARTQALHALLAKLRAGFPDVEIETCSSGGARLDLGVLAHTHRVWPSDNTDPVSRLRILRWASLAAPLEVLGSHVAGVPNPSTGRSHGMGLRCALALFGWMGVEADPSRLDADERAILSRAITLRKAWRARLAAPRVVRLRGRGLMQVGEGLALAVIDHDADGWRQDPGMMPLLEDPQWQVGAMSADFANILLLEPDPTPVWDSFSLLILRQERAHQG